MLKKALSRTATAPRAIIAAAVVCAVIISFGGASFAQGSKASGCDSDLMKRIFKLYFDQNEPAKGIEQLTKAIQVDKVRFSQKDLKNCVLPILGDYYKTKYDENFKGLIMSLLNSGSTAVIKNYFVGSRLKADVDAAVKEWLVPSLIVIAARDSVAVGDSIEISLTISNAAGVKLAANDVITKADVAPQALGEFKLGERSWFYARAKGSAQLTLYADGAQGQPMTAGKTIMVVSSMVAGPSMKWPLVSSGALVASGAAWIYFRMQAGSKTDECNSLAGDEWEKCNDDYRSLHRWELISGGVAAVATVATGYLWYRYFKSTRAATGGTAYRPGGERLRFEPYASGIAISYRF